MSESYGARLLALAGRRLVLASSSPRRMELLSSLGIPFDVRPTETDEFVDPGESAESACVRLAGAKALAAAVTDPSAWVLGADTIVIREGDMLAKPADDRDAARMLERLSGGEHEVWTGLAILRVRDGRVFTGAECTRVCFEAMPREAIEMLVRSGEGRDKAGAYGIQGLAGLFISRIEGDYYNVMGLPLARLRRLCLEAAA